MRGQVNRQPAAGGFLVMDIEGRISADHPLRAIKRRTDAILVAMRVMRKPYKTLTLGISVPKPLEIHELSERCGSVLSGSKTKMRVYLETI